MIRLFCLWVAFLTLSVGLQAQEIYLDTDEALQRIFPQAKQLEEVPFHLSQEDTAWLSQFLKTPVRDTEHTIMVSKDPKGRLLGYAIVLNELGKFEPITFMVGISPDGAVVGTEVMVYREKIGAEVRKKRFLKQFYNKSLKSTLRPDVDIDTISGATVSSWTMTFGVKKALGIVHLFKETSST